MSVCHSVFRLLFFNSRFCRILNKITKDNYYRLEWPRFHVASPRFHVVYNSSCFELSRVKDRFVIGLKMKEKHIDARSMADITFMYACLAKTGKHRNEGKGAISGIAYQYSRFTRRKSAV